VNCVNATRRPNRRGEGARLRAEIVAGATAVLEETGSEDAVTLRAVARRVGIAAPSIYGHFADRDEMLREVISEAFAELDAALVAAAAQEPDDVLGAVCRAYVEFARARPNRYRVMFGRHRAGDGGAVNEARPDTDQLAGAQAFSRLVQAVTHHRDDAPPEVIMRDATAVWVALHGYVSLRDSVPAFPWPPEETLLNTLIGRLVHDDVSPAD
jgi:AcrR family transcriptional regulator